MMDTQQMEQVLIHIIKNAIEAIGKNGIIEIDILNNPLRLLIKDNGPGIAPEITNKLFSPFYSTKTEGQGIGLTLTREILLNHGFDFSLSSSKERGWTTFEIVFS